MLTKQQKISMLDSETRCVLYFLVLVSEVANTISVRICLWRREGNVEWMESKENFGELLERVRETWKQQEIEKEW